MHTAAAVLSTTLVGFLIVVVPVLGRRRYRQLKLDLQTDPNARLRYYRNSIIREWILVGVVLVIGLMSGYSWRALGLPTSSLFRFNAGWTFYFLFIFVVGFVVGTALLHRRTAKEKTGMAAPLRGAVQLLPRSRTERSAFVGVALTAGICEEILYRGFGIYFVHWALPKASLSVAVVLTSLAFGAAHAYQGWLGVGTTALLGLLLGVIVAATGTLIVAMIVHALIDLRILVLPQRLLAALDRQANETKAEPAGDST
jgi:membrane protease YdiL (CAAX protease family)